MAARDEHYIGRCLHLADLAAQRGEVPVGAVIVDAGGDVVAQGMNLRETAFDATAHAEIVAIRAISALRRRWHLNGLTLYVTLEPCPMCAGAILQARVPIVVWGAPDPKAGAVESLYRLFEDPRLNHRVDHVGRVMADDCGRILSDFFKRKRLKPG